MKETDTAHRLKEIMKERNLKQVDILNKAKPICKKYGVKLEKNDLSQYISGKVEPKQDKLSVLAEALGVNEAWLMGYDVYQIKNPEIEEKKLEHILDNIDYNSIDKMVKNDKKNKILSYIDFYDLLLFLYTDKNSVLIEDLNQLVAIANNIYMIIKELNGSVKRNDILNLPLPDQFKLDKSVILSAKKAKLFLLLRKKYTKKDILEEIDKREIFKTLGPTSQNKNIHLSIISNYLDKMMNELLKNYNKKEND